MGSIVSLLLHLALLLYLVRPESFVGEVTPIKQGAGGPGPAGGGGGHTRVEVLNYIAVQPPPPPTPKPAFVFKPPEIVKLPPPALEPLKLEPLPASTLPVTGNAADGTTGAGPGTGGGVGAGAGTGAGSANGPGTGGGDQPNHPPQATEMFIPPLPVPASAKGLSIIAEFDVDERGRVLAIKFTETPDRSYNRRLTEVFKGFRFKPGTKADGTPIRMKAQITIELP